MTEKFVDAVFEGGGVKGVGLVGAVSVVEEKGYVFRNLAGTSAGAIVASLLAAGYSARELKEILFSLDYTQFKDTNALGRIPLLGPIVSLVAEKGIYKGDYFERWIGEKLAAKGKKTFRDLIIPGEKDKRYRYRLSVVVSDITNGSLVVLPGGLKKYGINPDDFPIAAAVRMSMSIPFFFEPVKMGGALFVDGGILSNFPIWIFDSPDVPAWPTFGFKLVEPENGRPARIGNTLDFAKALVTTMMDAHDKMHVENEDFKRTIAVPTLGVSTTDFGLSPARRQELYDSGVRGAKEFFKYWNFEEYVRTHRERRDPEYLSRVAKESRNIQM